MSHKLLILAQDENKYRALIEEARLVNLELVTQPAEDVDIVLGEPKRIKAALASLPTLSWAQTIWAGIEPLVGPASRRDYVLTNARGVFGGLMSEYVIGYLLAHERKILKRLEDKKIKHGTNLTQAHCAEKQSACSASARSVQKLRERQSSSV